MNSLKFYSSVVFVSNIQVAKTFYTQLLDCKVEHDFGKNISFFSGLGLWELEPNHIISENIKSKVNTGNKFELYFETENIQKIFSKLQSEGVSFLHEIHEEPWGQLTMRFFDPDNHLIEIGETLKTFVVRIYNTGLSKNEVSERTGIPIQTIESLLN